MVSPSPHSENPLEFGKIICAVEWGKRKDIRSVLGAAAFKEEGNLEERSACSKCTVL